ncbi:MAG: tannase/feruloyl esterase family alpha/beta hydrolase, partial [Pseudorhodoplanes sp.]
MIRTFVFAGAAFLAFSAGAQALTCEPFKGYMVSKFEIGLPSGDATIVSADTSSMPATMAGPEPTVAYCKLIGSIAPLDSNAPPIRFQINLPAQWNGRSVQYGGGGFNGTLISGLAQLRDAPADLPPPVALGFMTVGTDSGHDNSKLKEIQEFALNNEALENFAHASYKKVRDVAIVMARSIYGRAPDKLYFFGGSEGGREALMMAQRFPKDFDGIVSVVPVVNYTGANLMRARLAQLQKDGGW